MSDRRKEQKVKERSRSLHTTVCTSLIYKGFARKRAYIKSECTQGRVRSVFVSHRSVLFIFSVFIQILFLIEENGDAGKKEKINEWGSDKYPGR